MKVRIKGNSIRFRLSKSEVETVVTTGSLMETTSFINSTLTFELSVKPIDKLSAEYQNNTIRMFIPDKLIANWHLNDEVSIDGSMSLPGAETLDLLLEKDFKCIDRVEEDQSDYFPNPKENC
jgi:hypothetical protein